VAQQVGDPLRTLDAGQRRVLAALGYVPAAADAAGEEDAR
jgi:hypothetical protein